MLFSSPLGRISTSLALALLALAPVACGDMSGGAGADEQATSRPAEPAANGKEPAVGDTLPEPIEDIALAAPVEGKTRHAVFAGGCFWCTEAVFEELAGVSVVVSGYAGGTEATADYQAVSAGRTDHAEAIRITYDPSKVTYGSLLRIFFATHNPTQLNRQGPDEGRQYRSAVFYADEQEKAVAAAYIRRLDDSGLFDRKIATTLEPLEAFYTAEEYHQDYAKRNPTNPYIRINALPKLEKLKKLYGEMTKGE